MTNQIKQTASSIQASVVKLGMTLSFILNAMFLCMLVLTAGETQKMLFSNMVEIFLANSAPFGGSVIYEKWLKK